MWVSILCLKTKHEFACLTIPYYSYLFLQDDDEWIDVKHSSNEKGLHNLINDAEVSEEENENSQVEDEENSDNEEEEDEYEEDVEENQIKKKVKNQEDKEGNTKKEFENAEANNTISKKAPRNLKKKTYFSKLERKKRKIEMLAKNKEQKRTEYVAENKEKAAQISVERILTDEDFKRIDMALVKQQVTHAKRGVKRILEEDRGELVKLGDIENIFKKKRHDYAARLETVKVFVFYYLIKLNFYEMNS